jgi:hypothetical protein
MAALPEFAAGLWEEAKRFLEKAEEDGPSDGATAFVHAALMLGFASFEAHVNAMADDFLTTSSLNPHERGLLGEHIVELVDGEFQVKEVLKVQRLEDRVLFLCRRFSKSPIDRSSSYWGEFMAAARLRNRLTHPKPGALVIELEEVRRALTAIIELLNVMCLSLYRKKLPTHGRGLSSKRSF